MYRKMKKKIVKRNIYPVAKIKFDKIKKNTEIILFENITGYEYYELTGNTSGIWDEDFLDRMVIENE